MVCCKLLLCACIVLISNGFSASGDSEEAAPAADDADVAIATDKQLTQKSAAVAVLHGSRFRLVGLVRDTARLSVRRTAEQDSLIRYRSLLDSGHAARINFGDDTSRRTALPSPRRSMKRRDDDPFSAKKIFQKRPTAVRDVLLTALVVQVVQSVGCVCFCAD